MMAPDWTAAEDEIVRREYPEGGVAACRDAGLDRTDWAIRNRAQKLGVLRLRPPAVRIHANDPAIDAALRARMPLDGEKLRRMAVEFARPRWWMARRARELGLSVPRIVGRRWTTAEVQVLRDTDDLAVAAVQRALLRAGFERSQSEIHCKRHSLAIPAVSEGYSAAELGAILGCDGSTVARWIRLGFMRARPRGANGWIISHSNVRAFMREYPLRVDLRKLPPASQSWLIDVLTGSRDG